MTVPNELHIQGGLNDAPVSTRRSQKKAHTHNAALAGTWSVKFFFFNICMSISISSLSSRPTNAKNCPVYVCIVFSEYCATAWLFITQQLMGHLSILHQTTRTLFHHWENSMASCLRATVPCPEGAPWRSPTMP